MFVYKLKSKNLKVYIQVVGKNSRKYRVVKSFGRATNKIEETRLVAKANEWIKQEKGINEFDFTDTDSAILNLVDSISSMMYILIYTGNKQLNEVMQKDPVLKEQMEKLAPKKFTL